LTETIIVALVFAILLGVEWRYRLRSVRVGTVVLSIFPIIDVESWQVFALKILLTLAAAELVGIACT
jgi:hypothetical protein